MELAAVAAFSLACKMEEVYVPDLKDELQVGGLRTADPLPRLLEPRALEPRSVCLLLA